ncbi:hypothetical protein HK100_005466 [Physocladia obscura]|uniref:Carrier domain-containing protein n=1 Tax=Physocladia obscura TaxID=109957 RepID=A0AAD5XBW7_9FUNG|nr:hypothetical protein HK100_005466 [Physocladia obscura]
MPSIATPSTVQVWINAVTELDFLRRSSRTADLVSDIKIACDHAALPNENQVLEAVGLVLQTIVNELEISKNREAMLGLLGSSVELVAEVFGNIDGLFENASSNIPSFGRQLVTSVVGALVALVAFAPDSGERHFGFDFKAAQTVSAFYKSFYFKNLDFEVLSQLEFGKDTLAGGGERKTEKRESATLALTEASCISEGWSSEKIALYAKAAWALTCRKFTRSSIFVFGDRLSEQKVFPFSVELNDDDTVSAFLDQIESTSTVAKSHTFLTLEIFNSLFSSYPDLSRAVRTTFDFNQPRTSVDNDYDVEFSVSYESGLLAAKPVFNNQIVPSSQISLFLAEYEFTLSQLLNAGHATPLSEFWNLSNTQNALLSKVCFGPSVPVRHTTPHAYIDKAIADAAPNAVAVEFEDSSLSYADLDRAARVLSSEYLEKCGVQTGVVVALVMQRGFELIVAQLAVARMGATFLPLDSSFPIDRINFILRDAGVKVVITTPAENRREFNDFSVVSLSLLDLLSRPDAVFNRTRTEYNASPDSPFAILYTSGSTGVPKGVPLCNVAASCHIQENLFGSEHGGKQLQVTAISFDACTLEIWTCLAHNITLVLKGSEGDIVADAQKVTRLVLTPTGLTHLGNPSAYPNLTHVTVVGEACPLSLKNEWSQHVCFQNAYGPTEITFASNAGQLNVDNAITVGSVLPNVSVYILDQVGRPCPVGVVGEIVAGGIGVSIGYLGLPELTAEKFLPDPFWKSTRSWQSELSPRMFKTGDMGRILMDGTLDEVAAIMQLYDGVKMACAIAKDSKMLVGFVTPDSINSSDLRRFVASKLPAYMVPAVICSLPEIPVTRSGKIDKKTLESYPVFEMVHEGVAPNTLTEIMIAELWSEILRVPLASITTESSFFVLGGDSISVLNFKNKFSGRSGLNVISVGDVLTLPVLKDLAKFFDAATAISPSTNSNSLELKKEWGYMDTEVESVSIATPLQVSMLVESLKIRSRYVLCKSWVTTGIFFDEFVCAWKALSDTHSALRTTFVSDNSGIYQIILRNNFPRTFETIELEEEEGESEMNANLIEHQTIAGFEVFGSPLCKLIAVTSKKSSKKFFMAGRIKY